MSRLSFGSALTIGTEITEIDHVDELVDSAWRKGIRSFDTANNYGGGRSESLLGQSLARFPAGEYVISTKGGWSSGDSPLTRGLSRRHLRGAIAESLSRLNRGSVDLYYAHRPDPDVSISEVVRTFNNFIERGLCSYWGVSEWSLEELRAAVEIANNLSLEGPVAYQGNLSLLNQQNIDNGVRNYCRDAGIGFLGYAPLAQGLLTGKYIGRLPVDSRISKAEALGYEKTAIELRTHRSWITSFVQLCESFEVSPTMVALAWALQMADGLVFGASNTAQIDEAVKALEFELRPTVLEALARI